VVCEALSKMPGVTFQKPGGAFYVIAQLPVKDAEAFVKFLLKDFSCQNKTVLVAPMQDFYLTPGLGTNEIRIACVLKKPDLKLAMEILRLGLIEYQKTLSR
jgi:aspartate aminotransferase